MADEAAVDEGPKHSKRAAMSTRKKVIVFAVPAVLIVVALIGFIVKDAYDTNKQKKATQPLENIAAGFPAPVGSKIAFPKTIDPTPPTVVLGWKNEGASIDDACSQWRDAFRAWVGTNSGEQAQGAVVPGQSCSMSTTKDDKKVSLVVAVYGSEPPQATLTVTNR